MNYKYNEDECAFVRADNRGRRIKLTWDEAVEVCKLNVEGYSSEFIYKRLGLRIKKTSLDTFIKNFREGNIDDFVYEQFDNEKWYRKLRKKFERWLND